MRKLLAVFVAIVVVLVCSTASAGRAYVAAAPAVVYGPVAPVVSYYAPAVPMVTPAPVVVPSPILTPEAVVYPGAFAYPAPVIRARYYYRPVRPVYGFGVYVP